MGDSSNRVAIVTGGAGGLGVAIARDLLADGWDVVLADLQQDALDTAHRTAFDADARVRTMACDVTDPEGVQRLADESMAAHGRIDALVTCAGIGPLQPFLEMTLETWNQTIAVNLTGTFLCCQVIGRIMAAHGRGRIVTIASISGVRAGDGRAAYGISKAAVIQLTRQLAVELGPYGITVNGVGPGPVDTELALANHTPEMRADYHAMIPLARYATPTEIAGAVTFLCSDAAGYVNGQILYVDGGFLAGGVAVRSAQARARE